MENTIWLMLLGSLILPDYVSAQGCYRSCGRGEYCCRSNECCELIEGLSSEAYYGISIGSTVLFIIIIIIVVYVCRRRRARLNAQRGIGATYAVPYNSPGVPQSQFPNHQYGMAQQAGPYPAGKGPYPVGPGPYPTSQQQVYTVGQPTAQGAPPLTQGYYQPQPKAQKSFKDANKNTEANARKIAL